MALLRDRHTLLFGVKPPITGMAVVGVPVVENLLLEDGFDLLLEDGGLILLE